MESKLPNFAACCRVMFPYTIWPLYPSTHLIKPDVDDLKRQTIKINILQTLMNKFQINWSAVQQFGLGLGLGYPNSRTPTHPSQAFTPLSESPVDEDSQRPQPRRGGRD